ncbi:tetratricopeptide repeat protein [Chloroflexi bacterium TSY]|nr:tetratricopeptide repeat protein [Chloroflexi bacterium TSY]
MGHALLNLGSIHLVRRQLDDAERCIEQALESFTQSGNEKLVALAYNNWGLLELKRHQYAQAREYFQQSVALDPNSENLCGLAESFMALGDLAQAHSYAQQSLALAQEADERSEQAVALRTLGRIAQRQKAYEQAETELLASLNILCELDARYEMARTLSSLSDLMDVLSRKEEASQYQQQVERLWQEMGLGKNHWR